MDTLDDFLMTRPATAERPLLGLTILLVEDSRFASDGIRLLSLRSGARIRRADTLAHARRHLRVYRPSAVIVDMGLPDGSGAELIAELDRAPNRVPVILATSADPDEEEPARAAGADGFLAKPVARLAEFQAALLAHLPAERQPPGVRLTPEEVVEPDVLAYRDDLVHVAEVLAQRADDARTLGYVTQFVGSIALSAGDDAMARAVAALDGAAPGSPPVAALRALVEDRLAGEARI